MNEAPDMIQLCIRVPADLREQLRAAAVRDGRSMGSAARQALRQWIARSHANAEGAQNRRTK